MLVGQALGHISNAQLHTALLRHFHLRPINQWSSGALTDLCHGISHLEVGFVLICFQHLSAPNTATQRLPLA